jgi:hypothetical protein
MFLSTFYASPCCHQTMTGESQPITHTSNGLPGFHRLRNNSQYLALPDFLHVKSHSDSIKFSPPSRMRCGLLATTVKLEE